MKSYQLTESNLFEPTLGDSYRDHQPLSEIMPSRVGGVSRHFVRAVNTQEIIDAAKIAINNKIPYRVVGSGTGTLVGESGFPGLIIANRAEGLYQIGQSSRVTCDSGLDNNQLVNTMASRGLGGLEFMVLIPGTIGGAIITGATALGKRVDSYVREVTVFDPDNQRIVRLSSETFRQTLEERFSSQLVFPWVILSITLQFAALTQEEIIRRLSLTKSNLPKETVRIFGDILTEKLPPAAIDQEFRKQLKALFVSYEPRGDRLIIKKEATPKMIKSAVEIICQKAVEFGINTGPRITFLGYFSE